MGLPIEFYIYVGYGLFAFVAVITIMNFLLGGFLGPFMAVKRSRGKKLMVRVRNPVQDYFRAGEVLEGWLVFKDREKNTRRIAMVDGVVSRAATIYWVEIDDEKNCFFMRHDAKAVSTYDAVKTDSIVTRALYKPSLQDDLIPKVTMVVVIIILFSVIILGVFIYGIKSDASMTKEMVTFLYNASRPVAAVGGVAV